jgi:hypothetical protein
MTTRQITVAEWMAAGMTLLPAWSPQEAQNPVIGVTAAECDVFAEKIGARLPTWDESDQSLITSVGWWCAESSWERTVPDQGVLVGGRVYRGGSWLDIQCHIRQGPARSFRAITPPDGRALDIGCRVIAVSTEEPGQ